MLSETESSSVSLVEFDTCSSETTAAPIENKPFETFHSLDRTYSYNNEIGDFAIATHDKSLGLIFSYWMNFKDYTNQTIDFYDVKSLEVLG